MTGFDGLQDVYTFNVAGNWDKKLQELQVGLRDVGLQFAGLRKRLDATSGGVFSRYEEQTRKAAEATARLGGATEEQAVAAGKQAVAYRQLVGSSKSLLNAYDQTVQAVNRANVARARELIALRQVSEGSRPRIIEARAEAEAVARVTKALVDNAAALRVQALAAEAGVTLNAEGTRVFDAQAEAMRRATRAAQELQVAQLLQAQGLDARGRQIPPDTRERLQGPLPSSASFASLEEEDEARIRAAEEARRDRIRNLSRSLRGLETDADRAAAAQRRLAEQGAGANTIFGRFLFTFRRLVGVLAVFAAARAVTNAFGQMIRGAVEFNSTLEKTRVGLSGLIAASSEVLGPQGQRLTLEKQINAAQDLSILQMRELRRDAIRTTATYEDLSEALSQSVAPGLSAGLTLDQIRETTVAISQAAAGLGVAQNQLSEEIRALFQGTITPRNTRIATALGITNADIRRAKELGNLAGFLEERFSAVSAAGERIAKTFAGRFNAAQDAFKQLIAESSKPLFEQLKAGLEEFTSAIFDTTADNPIIDPQSLNLLDRFFKGLASGVANFRAAFRDLNVEGFAQVFGTIGQSVGLLTSLLSNAFAALFKVSSPFFGVLNTALSTVNSLTVLAQGFNSVFAGIPGAIALTFARITAAVAGAKLLLAGYTKVKTAVLAIRTAWAAVGAATVATDLATGRLTRTVAALRAITAVFTRPVLIAVAAFGFLEGILRRIAGISILEKIGEALAWVSDQASALIDGFLGIEEAAKDLSGNGLAVLQNRFASLVADLQDGLLEAEKSLRSFQAAASRDFARLGLSDNLTNLLREAEQETLSFIERRAAIEREILTTQAGQIQLQQKAASFSAEEALERFRAQPAQKKALELVKSAREELERLNATPSPASLGGIDAAFAGTEDLERRQAAQRKLSDLQTRFRTTLELESSLIAQAKEETEERARAESQLVGSRREMVFLSEKLSAAEEELGRIQDKRFASLAKEQNFNSIVAIGQQAADAIEALQVSSAAQDAGRIEAIRATAEVLRLETEANSALATRLRDIEVIKTKIYGLEQRTSAEGVEALNQARQMLSIAQAQNAVETTREDALIREARELERIARLREEGSVGDGFSETLDRLAREKDSMFKVGENLAEGLFTGLPQTIGSIISTSLVDGFNSQEAARAVQTFFANAVGQFVSDLLTAQLAKVLAPATTGNVEDAATVAKLQGVVAASASVTADAGVVATTITGSIASAARALTTAGGLLAAEISAALLAASSARIGLTAGGLTGGLVGAAKGGRVMSAGSAIQGFAHGGGVYRRRSRPIGIDPRDTVPAMLRPGEWVIRPEAVSHYGSKLFSALNNRRILRSSLTGIRSMSGPSGIVNGPKTSFATGGQVRSVPTSSSSSAPQAVLQFHDEQTMDRALAAGPRSMVRFSRIHRASMRAALGMPSRG